MRIAISHNKPQAEVIQIIDKSANDLFTMPLGAAQILDPQKRWDGNVMYFSFVGKQSIFKASISGNIEVTDKELIINVELPGFLKNLVPESQVRAAVEGKVKGLLA
jgi:hypothetical protein